MTSPSPSAETATTTADPTAPAAVMGRMVAAWAAHDAEAFADLFIEDGSMLLPGVYRTGRGAIREFMAAAYAGPYKGTTVTGTPLEIKPLAPGVVAVLTEGGVIPAGGTEPAGPIRASWILVRRHDGWKLAVYQNCPRDPA